MDSKSARRCSHQPCKAPALPGRRTCIAHAQRDEREEALHDAYAAGDLWFLRETVIGDALFNELLDAAPKVDGAPSLPKVDFTRAQFVGGAHWRGARFTGEASFRQAEFRGGADFGHVSFDRNAYFEGTEFKLGVGLQGTTFHATCGMSAMKVAGALNCRETRWKGSTSFADSEFAEDLVLANCTQSGPITLRGAHVRGRTTMEGFNADGRVSLDSVAFEGPVLIRNWRVRSLQMRDATSATGLTLASVTCADRLDLTRTAVTGRARFSSLQADTINASFCRFAGALSGRISAKKSIKLSGTEFSAPLTLRVASRDIDASYAQFDGGSLSIADGRVSLDNARTTRPLTIRGESARAVAVTLSSADTTNISLRDLDLRTCTFQGALNLDRMGLDGVNAFKRSPGTWDWVTGIARWATPRVGRRRTIGQHGRTLWRRETIEDEWMLRGGRFGNVGWRVTTRKPATSLTAIDIASLYRSLRKGREDAKDEAGAADFYYGEMEMRRLARPVFHPERLLLSMYRVLAGYGVRPLRPALSIVALILIGAISFQNGGFANPADPYAITPPAQAAGEDDKENCHVTGIRLDKWCRPSADAVTYAAAAGMSLPGETAQLTNQGRWTRIWLRVAVPAALALLVFALRSRVRR